MTRYSTEFFAQDVTEVAQQLLGKTLVFYGIEGIITETEAYRGSDDEASHAYKGPTPRSDIMFGPPGYSYVYLIYGIYHCLNIVTEEKGHASAVLIRGLQLPDIHLNGPGMICKYLNINKTHNGINICTHPDFYIKEGIEPISYQATPRIGIKKAVDKLWRFVIT